MNLKFERYGDYEKRIPTSGKYILASQCEETVVVYQAFRPAIADYAVAHQHFGGPDYSYQRMSWIKPNFLWMMYRSGWGTKPGQERTLAIWLKKTSFDMILSQAAYSSFTKDVYGTEQEWKNDLQNKPVRLQWDPDHDPLGARQERRAIQLGLKEEVLREFGKTLILKIEDVSEFVEQQRQLIKISGLAELMVPCETIYIPTSKKIQEYLGLNNQQQL
jgi:hypothetical protein